MKKKYLTACLCAALLFPSAVFADVLDYEATIEEYTKEKALLREFEIEDGDGQAVSAVAREDCLYSVTKDTVLRTKPGENGEELVQVPLGETLVRVAVCDNGWSKVKYIREDGSSVMGYTSDSSLTEKEILKKTNDQATSRQDWDILDYPGRKDGEVIGEILEMDEVERTAMVDGVWSQIVFLDAQEQEQIGYVPTNILEIEESENSPDEEGNPTGEAASKEESDPAGEDNSDDKENGEEIPEEGEVDAAIIPKSEGDSVFAEAVDGVTVTEDNSTTANGVRIGTPVAVSSSAVLKPLGTFRITHYCPCSICCGPWANGITSTGVTATTNHTIAVDPSVIPYGSQVVINGQVYVAEDCGGAIKGNRIDVYVATHQEGESKGVYYAEAYLIQ